MLSHLVGAANRADIRRLSALEAENAALREKLVRQQDHLRETLTSRDARIRELGKLLASRIAEPGRATGATRRREALAAAQRASSTACGRRPAPRRRRGAAGALPGRARREREQRGARSGAKRAERGAGSSRAGRAGRREMAGQPCPPPSPASPCSMSAAAPTSSAICGRSASGLAAGSCTTTAGRRPQRRLAGGPGQPRRRGDVPGRLRQPRGRRHGEAPVPPMAKPFLPLRSSGAGSLLAALDGPEIEALRREAPGSDEGRRL